MSTPGKDARRHRRFTVDVEAIVHDKTRTGWRARARDVSRSGICLVTDRSLPGGQTVVIEMVLAFGHNAFSEPLRIEAHVVWCTAIGDSFQVGVMFEELSEEQESFLEMFLHFLDGTIAPKGVPSTGDDDADDEADKEPTSPDIKDDPFR